MKQSMLMKTKRSIKAILMMLQPLVMLFAMSLSMSSHAQMGNLTVTRTPSTMIAGQPFTIVWSSSEPTAVATKYSCVSPAGGFAGSATLSVSGSASGTADPNWLWKDSTCAWTVVNAAGSILASRTDIMKTVAAPVNGVTYIHTDGLGSPVAKSDANGNLIAGSRTRYEPYGMAVAGTATPTIGFTGHVNDADTGLTYMQQRYYDPVAGRFLSTDPVLTDVNTAGSFNRYTYANNNPYRNIDPDGRTAVGINFENYKVDTGMGFKAPLGHGGILLIDDKTGGTKYYEFGRYDPKGSGIVGAKLPQKDGNIRNVQVPNATIGKDGKPTQASLDKIYASLEKGPGHGATVKADVHNEKDAQKVEQSILKTANDPNRETYGLLTNNCKDFRNDAIKDPQTNKQQ